MKVNEAIKKRYSCRDYSKRKVSRELIKELLKLANQAPSAANKQNREFIVITDKEGRKFLARLNNQEHLEGAPVVILAISKLDKETTSDHLNSLKKWDMTVSGIKPDEFKVTEDFKNELKEMKYKWMISDTAAAVENLMLAAVEKGLSTCWIGIMDFKEIIRKFGLPDGAVPVCLITLGYEKEAPKYRTDRKDINELIHWERY